MEDLDMALLPLDQDDLENPLEKTDKTVIHDNVSIDDLRSDLIIRREDVSIHVEQ